MMVKPPVNERQVFVSPSALPDQTERMYHCAVEMSVRHSCAVCRASLGPDENVVEVSREASAGWYGGVELTRRERRYVHPHEATAAPYLGWRVGTAGTIRELVSRHLPAEKPDVGQQGKDQDD